MFSRYLMQLTPRGLPKHLFVAPHLHFTNLIYKSSKKILKSDKNLNKTATLNNLIR